MTSAFAEVVARPTIMTAVTSSRPFPTLDHSARIGLVGDIVETIDPHTESDPNALIITFLIFFGNAVGRTPYFQIESTRHYPNEFGVLVGDSSKARKGTAAGRIKDVFRFADGDWVAARIHAGLSSGEGVIHAVRDGDGDEDAGVPDKRLMVLESEFASPLKVMQRDGNILSCILRDGWDDGTLTTLTKNNPSKAHGAHVSIIGHITSPELHRSLDQTEMANGFGNRFLFAVVRRSKLLPLGGALADSEIEALGNRVQTSLKAARRIGSVKMTAETENAWRSNYNDLSKERAGLLGALTARAEAHVIRLALIYALIDGASEIALEHLWAAIAVWEYCDASVQYLFGDSLGDPIADPMLEALRKEPAGFQTLRTSS